MLSTLQTLLRGLRGVKTPLLAGGMLLTLLLLFDASFSRKSASFVRRYDPASFVTAEEASPRLARAPEVQILDVVRSQHRLHIELVIFNARPGGTAQGRVWGAAEFSGDAGRWVQRTEPQTYKARMKTFKAVEFPLPLGGNGRFEGYEIFVSDDATGVVKRLTGVLPGSAS